MSQVSALNGKVPTSTGWLSADFLVRAGITLAVVVAYYASRQWVVEQILAAFAGFLDAASAFAPLSKHAERIGHRWLDRIERIILAIAMLRARPRVRALRTNRPFALHRLKESARSRAVIGAKQSATAA